MQEFLAAVAKLLIECGESVAKLRDVDAECADALNQVARKVAELMPAALVARPDADRAAVLLLSAGSKVVSNSDYMDDWFAAEKQAMQLLGIVPLATAAR